MFKVASKSTLFDIFCIKKDNNVKFIYSLIYVVWIHVLKMVFTSSQSSCFCSFPNFPHLFANQPDVLKQAAKLLVLSDLIVLTDYILWETLTEMDKVLEKIERLIQSPCIYRNPFAHSSSTYSWHKWFVVFCECSLVTGSKWLIWPFGLSTIVTKLIYLLINVIFNALIIQLSSEKCAPIKSSLVVSAA